jgi:hypothetical protein
MGSPTQEAEQYFQHANNWLFQVVQKSIAGQDDSSAIPNIAMGLNNMAYGLGKLSVGLRATYQKLEEVERLLKQPGRK